MVIGSRKLEDSVYEEGLFRKAVSRVFTFYAHLLGSRMTDPMTGFFAFNKRILKGVQFKPFKWKVALELEMKTKCRIKELPIKFNGHRGDGNGESKAGWRTAFKIALDMLEVLS